MTRTLIGLAALLALATAATADTTVVLKDGRTLTGQLIESGDSVGVATDDGLVVFRRDEIERIDRDAFGRATAGQLAAYRRTEYKAEQVSHPAEAVAIWHDYLQAAEKDNPLIAEARKQIDRWAEAVRQGKVVWAGDLITPAERDQKKRDALRLLGRAVDAHRAADYRKAASILRDAVRLWPEHPGIRFYLGLALQRLRQPLDAAKQYRQVLEEYPDHVPTLNNLAAVECTRKQYLAGVPLMLRAVTQAPDVIVVSDNAYRTLLRIARAGLHGFESQTAQLRNAAARIEAAMQKQGLRRWGTSWVTEDRYRDMKQTNDRIDAQLAELVADVEALNQEIEVLRARITELEHQRRFAPTEWAVRNGVDTDGDGVPDVFYPQDTLTKEKIDLLLADHGARLAAKEQQRAAGLAQIQQLRMRRIDPVVELAYVLLDDPGDAFMAGGNGRVSEIPVAPSYVGPTSTAEIVRAIRSGRAVIMAEDGTFLGKVSDDLADAQAIGNPDGLFGDRASQFSLLNPETKFTARQSDQSVHDPAAKSPPRLFFDGQLLAYVTENPHLVPRIRLADVLAVMRGE